MTPAEPAREPPPPALGPPAPGAPIAVPTRTIVVAGIGLWSIALLVTLVTPSLHTGDRSWWPWTCVTGILLGVFALWLVRRRRGNAAGG
ncbi:MAG: DUF2530 domain-containing protein [Ornithinibacter sp.]